MLTSTSLLSPNKKVWLTWHQRRGLRQSRQKQLEHRTSSDAMQLLRNQNQTFNGVPDAVPEPIALAIAKEQIGRVTRWNVQRLGRVARCRIAGGQRCA